MAEISPLRRRMIEDMTVRNLSPATPSAAATTSGLAHVCPCCGGLHLIRTTLPRAPPGSAARRR